MYFDGRETSIMDFYDNNFCNRIKRNYKRVTVMCFDSVFPGSHF